MRIYTSQPWLYIQPLHELFAGRRNAAWPVGVAGLLLLPYTNLLGSYYSCFNLDKKLWAGRRNTTWPICVGGPLSCSCLLRMCIYTGQPWLYMQPLEELWPAGTMLHG